MQKIKWKKYRKKAKTKGNHGMNIKWYDSVKGGDVD